MKRNFILIALATICWHTQAQTVIKVIDGDTYKVLFNGKERTIRLANVDTPELDQYLGKTIKDSLAQLLEGTTLSLEAHRSDVYRRLIVTVTFKGMSMDSLLLAKGWAWFYTKYSRKADLKKYEAAAKLNGLGVWQCVQPVPP
jgi:micrococcal nuclease